MAKVAPLEPPTDHSHNRASGPSGRRGSAASQHSDGANADTRGSIVRQVRHSARDFFYRSGWYDSALAVSIRKFLRGRPFAVITMISLAIALFFGELWALLQVPSNAELDIILTLVFAIFLFEFLGLTLTDASYLLGFFFWMDLLGTASMVFDISFMAGADASNPHKVNRLTNNDGANENVIVVRAARAAKLGARAGRISRVLKILRFLPFLMNSEQDSQRVKMARVISNQLTNVLSTRVAFLTICIVVVMPVFNMFTYPEVDDSMAVWTELLNENAVDYFRYLDTGAKALATAALANSTKEAEKFNAFYSELSYGPFRLDYGEYVGDTFVPGSTVIFNSWEFSEPKRKSSIVIVTKDRSEAWFDLSTPKQQEAGASIGLICFIILVMVSFGLVMSSSISVIALQPLERMLSVVRERCTQIFKYTSDLEDEDSENKEEDAEEYDDMEHASEFVLLEKVVTKLAAIAHLSTTNQEPEVKADMSENEVMVLNWMQGAQAPVTQLVAPQAVGHGRQSVFQRPKLSADMSALSHDIDMPRGPSTANAVPASVIEALETSSFNSLDLSKEMKIAVAHVMVTTFEGCTAWVSTNVKQTHLHNFIVQAEQKYLPNPFHNFAHAIDVQYCVFRYMRLVEADCFLPDVAQFWLMIAAVGHDLGHIGVNNPYLVETSHEVAIRYNDRSPLENMHCAKLFHITTDPEANVFAQVEKDLYKEMRKGIIDSVLHTDVTKHNEMIKELGLLYQMNSEVFDSMEPGPAITQNAHSIQLTINSLLHGADIGNPMKPWELCKVYANLCLEEFFAQGDLEKAAGIPVQMLNDRDKVNRPNSQIGFIEFVIAPMVEAMVNMFPQLDSLALYLGQNIVHWQETWQEEVSPSPEAVAKVSVRVKKVADKCKGLMRPEE